MSSCFAAREAAEDGDKVFLMTFGKGRLYGRQPSPSEKPFGQLDLGGRRARIGAPGSFLRLGAAANLGGGWRERL